MLPIFGHCLIAAFLGRRSVSAVLLGAYLVTAAGIPLPSGAKPHATDESYPCANCACGCTSAEQCWRSCCCHSLAERFAWAEEHHVRPPDYAIAAAQLAGLDLHWLGMNPATTNGAAAPKCCKKIANKSLPPCCQKHVTVECGGAEHDCCGHTDNSQRRSKRGDLIVAFRALGCQGQSLNWLAAVPTLIVARLEFSYDLPRMGWLGPATSEAA